MPISRRATPWSRYGFAFVLVVLATVARAGIDPLLEGQAPFAFHFIAVIVVAWFVGLGPAVAAAVASAFAALYLFVEPRFAYALLPGSGIAAAVVFALISIGLGWQIDRWRRAERALLETRDALADRASRLELQARVLDNAYDAIFLRDQAELITFWNHGAEEMYGWAAADAISQNPHRLLHTDRITEDAIRESLARTGAWLGQITHTRKDGRQVISDSRQIRVDGGLVLEINRDVTARERAEESARESQRLLRATMDNFPTVIAFKNADGRFIAVNGAVEQALGAAKEQIVGRTMAELGRPDAAERLRVHEREVMASRQPQQFEEATAGATRTLHHLNTIFPLIDSQGRVYGTGHISHDITAVKEAQTALIENERRLSALMNATTESIWLLDRENVLAVNTTGAERVGRTVDELRGTPWRTTIPPAVADVRGAHIARVFATGQPVRFEDERHGRRFDHTFYPVFGEQGEVTAISVFSRDVTEQKRAEEALRETTQRLLYHVNHSPLAVIEFGPDMRLTRWSGAAERLFGWTADEVLGRRMDDFRWVFTEDVPIVQVVSESLQTGTDPQRVSSNRNFRKDGTIVHCEWYNSSLFDGDGRLRSILSLVLDVTDRKRLESELRTQAEQLAHANRLKDEFLATLSHELRTPLNAILGWAQILSKTGEPDLERIRRGVESIDRNARLQARLVEDLLDVSRIMTGSVRLDLQRVEFGSIAEQAVDATRVAADAKQLRIAMVIEPGLTLTADPMRLQQVIWNLLANAVKFTPRAGTVTLSARSDGRSVAIAVRDTGMGIRPDFLPYVFDRFTQADSSPTREHGGLGLGLAIVRHIVELHGGTIGVASEGEGKGAEFTVRLPMRVGKNADPAADAQRPFRASALSGVRVLTVDDNRDSLDVMEAILEMAGATVVGVPSAEQAEARLQGFAPDVLVSDIAMADADGYTLIRRLRASGSPFADIPAVAVTAYGGDANRNEALAAGYNRHLAKPIGAEDLVAAVASLVGRSVL